jgi:hypothetical protein
MTEPGMINSILTTACWWVGTLTLIMWLAVLGRYLIGFVKGELRQVE